MAKNTPKQTPKPNVAATPDAGPTTDAGVPLGRPAFPANLLPIGRDASAPAGAVQLQVPQHMQEPKPEGAPTLTIMNPTPIAAAPSTSPRKRG